MRLSDKSVISMLLKHSRKSGIIIPDMKRRPSYFITLYLVIAVTGAFAFTAAGSFQNFESRDTFCGGFLSSVNHAADCLAETTVTINKVNVCSSAPMCSGWQRIFLPSGIQNTRTYLTGVSIQTADEYLVPIQKNTILIKLRI